METPAATQLKESGSASSPAITSDVPKTTPKIKSPVGLLLARDWQSRTDKLAKQKNNRPLSRYKRRILAH